MFFLGVGNGKAKSHEGAELASGRGRMTDREDRGKNLLRMLTSAQPAPAPPNQPRNAWSNPEITPVTSSYPIPATDVRSAAAGEQHYRRGPTNFAGSPAYLSHYPAPTSAPPGSSAGANLLRMIQQGAQQSPAETSTLQQRQPHQQQHLPQQGQQQPHYQQQQQQQQQHPAASPSSISAQRSVAEQQERLLKRFLDINDGSSNTPNDTQLSSPATPPAPYAAYPPAAGPPPPPPPPPLPPAVVSGPQGHKRQNSKSRGQERGKGRNQRGGRGRGIGAGPDNSGAGYEPASPAQGSERKRAATPGRGPTGKQGRGAGQNHGATAVRETRKGKKGGGARAGGGGGGSRGGGGGGGRAPATSPAYAWSSFQNSPDPKSIPIPSLKNLFLDGEASPRERAPGAAPPSLYLREEDAEDSRWGGEDAEAAGLHTPPPAPERAAGTVTESRSTAKRAEDDIKRMLWGDGWHLNDDS